MKIVEFRSREDKLALVGQLFGTYLQGRVLDVGCDRKHISKFVKGTYFGIDISGMPDAYVNVEHGLPFKDKSFDTIIAFDILEHIEKLHFLFDELCRVARKYVIIGLPNLYEWRFRLMFLIGKPLSGKYGLPITPPDDRHRWLFSLNEARHFVSMKASRNGFCVREEVFGYYKYRKLLARLLIRIGIAIRLPANLLAYHYWIVIERMIVSEVK